MNIPIILCVVLPLVQFERVKALICRHADSIDELVFRLGGAIRLVWPMAECLVEPSHFGNLYQLVEKFKLDGLVDTVARSHQEDVLQINKWFVLVLGLKLDATVYFDAAAKVCLAAELDRLLEGHLPTLRDASFFILRVAQVRLGAHDDDIVEHG